MRKIVSLTIIIFIIILVTYSNKNIKTNQITMPNDFAISFSYGIDKNRPNILDTYKGMIQKDLILDGIVDIGFSINEDNLKVIYSEICKYGIDKIRKNMISKNLTSSNEIFMMMPNSYYNMHFTMNGTDYNVRGDSTAFGYIDKNRQADNFCNFITFMIQYIESTNEYKKLPVATGGYE